MRLIAIAIATAFFAVTAHADETPPNIVVIYVDDLGWADINVKYK